MNFVAHAVVVGTFLIEEFNSPLFMYYMLLSIQGVNPDVKLLPEKT